MLLFGGILCTLVILGIPGIPGTASSAEAAEKLSICRPCSREFLPMAQEIITELGLEDEIRITPSSCLGPCQAKYVIKFQGTVYSYMNANTLREMLISVYSLEGKAPAE
jgi:(2Fe-2S) ferredoxin